MNLKDFFFKKEQPKVFEKSIEIRDNTTYRRSILNTQRPNEYVIRQYSNLYSQYTGLQKTDFDFIAQEFAGVKQIIVEDISQTEWKEVDPTFPALPFFNKLNANMTNEEFKQLMIVKKYLLGEVFQLIDRNEYGYPVQLKDLFLTNWESMQPVLDQNGTLVGYNYIDVNNKKTFIERRDLICFIERDPSFPHKGLGRIAANQYTFELANEFNIYQVNFIKNGAIYEFLVKIPEGMAPEEAQAMIEKMRDDMSGTEHTNELHATNADIIKLGASNKEMDYLKTTEYVDDKIHAISRVNRQLVGDSRDMGSGTQSIAIREEWKEVHLKPMLRMYDSIMTEFLKNNWEAAKNCRVMSVVEPVRNEQFIETQLNSMAEEKTITVNESRIARGFGPLYFKNADGTDSNILDPKGNELIGTF